MPSLWDPDLTSLVLYLWSLGEIPVFKLHSQGLTLLPVIAEGKPFREEILEDLCHSVHRPDSHPRGDCEPWLNIKLELR